MHLSPFIRRNTTERNVNEPLLMTKADKDIKVNSISTSSSSSSEETWKNVEHQHLWPLQANKHEIHTIPKERQLSCKLTPFPVVLLKVCCCLCLMITRRTTTLDSKSCMTSTVLNSTLVSQFPDILHDVPFNVDCHAWTHCFSRVVFVLSHHH